MLSLLPLLLPFYTARFTIAGLPTTLLEGWIMIMAVMEGVHAFRSHTWASYAHVLKTLPRLWKCALFLFVLASLLALVPTASLWQSLGLWRAYVLEPLIVFVIALVALRRNGVLHRLLLSSAIAVLIVSAIAIVQWFFPSGIPFASTRLWTITDPIWSNPLTHRSTSVFGYPNAVGLFVAPFLPLLLYGWRRSLKKTAPSAHPQQDKRTLFGPLYAISATIGLMAILLARSHGALAALAVTALLAAILTQPKERILKGFVAILFAFILLLPFSGPWLDGFSFGKPSGQLRLGQWKETITMLTDRPLLGAGFGNYQHVIAPYHNPKLGESFLFPHTVLLNVWSEMGLLGVIAFSLLLWSILRTLLHNKTSASLPDSLPLALLCSFLIILIHGLVDVPYFKNDLAVQFWLLAAMAATVDNHEDTAVG